DAVRIRIPDVGRDISQQGGGAKTGAGNAPDLC
ncbi:transport protein, partial [Salmonella enterica subsp. enterica serovar Corvallis]|nr:transport protein [Salmonella enterica subsp. enterica serovar Corvallis]